MPPSHLLQLLRYVSVAAGRQKGTGLPRLSEAMRRWQQHHWKGGELEIDNFQGDLRISVNLRDHMGSRIFWFDSYSETELKLIRKLLAPGDLFIDLGANIGEFTLPAARRVGVNGRVVAVEPVPAIRDKLCRHISWNDLGQIVTVVPDAVGDVERTISIFGPAPGASELHEGLPTAFASKERPVKIADVRQTTLDQLTDQLGLGKVSGIKLDIEGSELQALQGGRETLKRFRPWLLCEIGANTCEAAGYTPWDIVELLFALDYRVSKIGEKSLRPILTEADLGPWQNILAEPRHS